MFFFAGYLAPPSDSRRSSSTPGKAVLILIAEIERLRFDTERAPGASNSALIEASKSEDEQAPIEKTSSGTSLIGAGVVAAGGETALWKRTDGHRQSHDPPYERPS